MSAAPTADTAAAAVGKGLDGKWHLLTGVIGTETLRFYLDGVLEQEKVRTTQIIKNTNPVTFGQHYFRYTKTELDEIRIARVPRSTDWIKLSYKTQKPGAQIVQIEELKTRPQ